MSTRIGRNIKQIRELKNFTQEHFAKKLGMTTSGYSKIERGEVIISIEKLQLF
ncbi:MAG: helix-turn-helix transcriptional regulator [Cryomorphaceae bacterium]|nr:helix-turn-helix transcriptional regulator [Cryomorphaceae bacterium]